MRQPRSASSHSNNYTELPSIEYDNVHKLKDSDSSHTVKHSSAAGMFADNVYRKHCTVDRTTREPVYLNSAKSHSHTIKWPNSPFFPARHKASNNISSSCIHRSDDTLNVSDKQMDVLQISPLDLAQQITLIELDLFKEIKPEEFLSLNWSGREKHLSAPHIVASTRWFNQIIFWLHQEILNLASPTKRCEMLSHVIRTAKKLVELNNFYSAKAFVSALQMECVYRLQLTWSGLSSRDRQTFKKISNIFDEKDNFLQLRTIQNIATQPCIPYLGLYLNDLIYISVACPSTVTHGNAIFTNQVRLDRINNILRIISHFQTSTYPFTRNESVASFIESQKFLDELQRFIEDSNYKTSLRLEPPGTVNTQLVCNNSSTPIRRASKLLPKGSLSVVSSLPVSSTSSCDSSQVKLSKNVTNSVPLFANISSQRKSAATIVLEPAVSGSGKKNTVAKWTNQCHKRLGSWTSTYTSSIKPVPLEDNCLLRQSKSVSRPPAFSSVLRSDAFNEAMLPSPWPACADHTANKDLFSSITESPLSWKPEFSVGDEAGTCYDNGYDNHIDLSMKSEDVFSSRNKSISNDATSTETPTPSANQVSSFALLAVQRSVHDFNNGEFVVVAEGPVVCQKRKAKYSSYRVDKPAYWGVNGSINSLSSVGHSSDQVLSQVSISSSTVICEPRLNQSQYVDRNQSILSGLGNLFFKNASNHHNEASFSSPFALSKTSKPSKIRWAVLLASHAADVNLDLQDTCFVLFLFRPRRKLRNITRQFSNRPVSNDNPSSVLPSWFSNSSYKIVPEVKILPSQFSLLLLDTNKQRLFDLIYFNFSMLQDYTVRRRRTKFLATPDSRSSGHSQTSLFKRMSASFRLRKQCLPSLEVNPDYKLSSDFLTKLQKTVLPHIVVAFPSPSLNQLIINNQLE